MISCTTADRDLTSQISVFSYANTTGQDLIVMGIISFGDGNKDLDGSGGDFELTLEIGGQTVEPDPQIINFSTAVRCMNFTHQFTLYDTETVEFKVKSPNAADTDVTVKACLIETGSADARTSQGTVKNVYGPDVQTTRGAFPENL